MKWGRNPRQATEAQTKDLEKSLDRFNLADPLIINTDNTIIGGHFRYDLLIKKFGKDKTVDVRVPDRKLSAKQVEELNLRLNKNLGEWNFDLLSNFDEDLLTDVGFTIEELDTIFNRIASFDPLDDEAPPLPKKTHIKRGHLFQLGAHRLLCGDAADRGDVELLMQKDRANLIFTDPPYGVDYSDSQGRKIVNDSIDIQKFTEMLVASFKNYHSVTDNIMVFYMCFAHRTSREFYTALEQGGFLVSNEIIWVKDVQTFGFADYRYKYEPILYGWKRKYKHKFYGGRQEVNVWEYPSPSSMAGRKDDFGKTVPTAPLHPNKKPVALILRALQNSSQRNSIILDFFGGSGSTMIACEKSNRICRMMEIDPCYCDVIIERWEKFTGQKAKRISA
jgi:DNA modification methylase